MLRRRGRLLGTVARTAVVAGTATATANAVNRHSQNKAAEKEAAAEQEAAEQAPPPPPQPVYQAPPPPPPAPARLRRPAGRRSGRPHPAACRIAGRRRAVRGRVRRGQGQTARDVNRGRPRGCVRFAGCPRHWVRLVPVTAWACRCVGRPASCRYCVGRSSASSRSAQLQGGDAPATVDAFDAKGQVPSPGLPDGRPRRPRPRHPPVRTPGPSTGVAGPSVARGDARRDRRRSPARSAREAGPAGAARRAPRPARGPAPKRPGRPAAGAGSPSCAPRCRPRTTTTARPARRSWSAGPSVLDRVAARRSVPPHGARATAPIVGLGQGDGAARAD